MTRRKTKLPSSFAAMAAMVGYECFGCYGSRQYRTPNIDLMTGLSNARNYSAFSILNRDQRPTSQELTTYQRKTDR